MRKLLLALIFSVLLGGCEATNGKGQSPIAPLIFIASGQSNMAVDASGLNVVPPGELPAIPSYVVGYMAQAGIHIDVIPTAIPSTSLSCWQTDGKCFNDRIRPLRDIDITGVLWWQGESDTTSLDLAASYGTRFRQMILDWRAFFGSDVPFYVVQLGKFPIQSCGDNCPGWELVKAGQNGDLPGVHIIVTEDITNGDIHHPAYAYSEIAMRIATAILSANRFEESRQALH